MRTILLLILLSAFINVANSQENKQLAKVNKQQGKEIYVMCEPERAYDVVSTVNSTVSQLLGEKPTIKNMLEALLNKSVSRELKGKLNPFDALITTDGNNGTLVKFKDGNEELKGIGRITKLQGKEVYVLCEPIREYDVVEKVNSIFTQLLGKSSIDDLINELVIKSVDKEKKGKISSFDALITPDGDIAILVKFK